MKARSAGRMEGYMDTKRVKQILGSADSIQVLHNGSPVWIDSVKTNNTADITYINDEDRKENVPVYTLVERETEG